MVHILPARGRRVARLPEQEAVAGRERGSERSKGLAPCLFYLFIDFVRPMSWIPALSVIPLGAVAAVWGFVKVATSRQRAIPRPVWYMLGLAAVMAWNVPWAMNNYKALMGLWGFITLVIGGVLPIAALPGSVRAMRYLMSAYVFMHVPMAIHAILHAGRGLSGWGGDENDLACALNVAMGLGIYLFLEDSSKLKRLLLLVAIGVMLSAVVASISRGGFLGLASLGGYILLAGPRRGVVAFCVILAVVGLLLFAPATYWDEVRSIKSAAEPGDTGEQRFYLWGMAWRMFLDHPFVGVGTGNYGIQAPYYEDTERAETSGFHTWGRVAHSLYFTLLAEQGAIGTIFFVAIVGWFVAAQWRIRRWFKSHRTDETARSALLLGSGLAAGTFALLATGTFITVTYYPIFWVLAGMMASLDAVAALARGKPA